MEVEPSIEGELGAEAYRTLLAGIDRVYEAMDDLDALGLAMVETVASGFRRDVAPASLDRGTLAEHGLAESRRVR